MSVRLDIVVVPSRLLFVEHTYGGEAADEIDVACLIHLVDNEARLSFANNWLVG